MTCGLYQSNLDAGLPTMVPQQQKYQFLSYVLLADPLDPKRSTPAQEKVKTRAKSALGQVKKKKQSQGVNKKQGKQ